MLFITQKLLDIRKYLCTFRVTLSQLVTELHELNQAQKLVSNTFTHTTTKITDQHNNFTYHLQSS